MARIWSNWSSHTLLGECKILQSLCKAIQHKAISHKIKYTPALWPRGLSSRTVLKGHEHLCPQKFFYEDVQRSLIHNSPILEIIQRAMNRKIDHWDIFMQHNTNHQQRRMNYGKITWMVFKNMIWEARHKESPLCESMYVNSKHRQGSPAATEVTRRLHPRGTGCWPGRSWGIFLRWWKHSVTRSGWWLHEASTSTETL